MDIVKKELSEISPDIEIIATEYKGCNKPLKCRCKECENIWYPIWDNLKQGKGCMKCRRKKGNAERRMSIEEVRFLANEISSNLLIFEDDYVDENVKMKCGCADCNREFLLNWRSIRNGVNCTECTKEEHFKNRRMTIESIEKYIEENNIPIKLLSNHYVNAKENLECKCKDCGYLFEKSWGNIKSLKQYCPKCGVKKRWDNRKNHNIKKSESLISKKFPQVKILSDESPNVKFKMKCFCKKCDLVFYQNHNNFQSGKGCPNCGIKRRSGKNHFRYNPDLTVDERTKTREELYGESKTIWRKKVHEKFGWKCVVCNSNDKLVAHHLDGFNAYPKLRFEVENGVTICDSHHKEFHSEYGYGNNTKEQFEEYLKHAK